MDLRLISWCLDGASPVDRGRQAAWLASQDADLIALQDVPTQELSWWREHADVGLEHVLAAAAQEGRRRVLLLSRWPLTPAARLGGDKGRYLEARVDAPKPFHVATLRVPTGRRHEPTDIGFLRAANDRREQMEGPAVVCGFLGTPAQEHDTGESQIPIPFHRARPAEADEEIRTLTLPGWIDAYRVAHPRLDRRRDHSIRPKAGFPRRTDHVFTAGPWSVAAARYDHGCLDSGLGLHAPLVADLHLQRGVAAAAGRLARAVVRRVERPGQAPDGTTAQPS